MTRLGLTLLILLPNIGQAADWSQFRGPGGASVAAPDVSLPTTWDTGLGKNVAWSAALPGKGPASPIVVGERVVVTASSGQQQDRLHVLCLDAKSGERLWHRQMWATGRTRTHPSSANAAPTPASDGQHVFAFYSSNDLICLDLNGNLKWFRGLAYDYPKAGNDIGMSSSPVVADETVVVQIENQGDSFVAGLATDTGQTLWRRERPKAANWSSPIMGRTADGRSLLLLKSSEGVQAFDPRTGTLLWDLPMDAGGIPSIATKNHRFYVPTDGVIAFELSEREPAELWNSTRLRPGPASPIISEGRIYVVNRAGVLTCGDVETGEQEWQLRLKGTFWSTPVLVNDCLYCINDAGLAQVVQLGDEGRVIGTADFGETIQSSPAVANNALYVRGNSMLWKIAQP